MNNLIIPENRQQTINFLINLSPQDKDKLIYEIEKAPSGLLINSLSEYLQDKLNFEFNLIHDIIELLFELYNVVDYSKVDAYELTEDIIKAIKSEDFINKEVELTSFQDMMYKLLTFKSSLGITQRASKLTNEFENVFIDHRIITDVRPIFKTDNSEEIETSLIIHSLKVNYNHNGNGDKNNAIFFALDNTDLKKLKDSIIRAESKEEIIKKTFDKAKILNFIK